MEHFQDYGDADDIRGIEECGCLSGTGPASGNTDAGSDFRVRHDRVDKAGKVTLRHHGKLFHIGIGRTLAGTQIILLIHDLDIRIIHAATGEIIRTLTLDPEHQYQPTGANRGGPSRPYGPYRPRKRKQSEP